MRAGVMAIQIFAYASILSHSQNTPDILTGDDGITITHTPRMLEMKHIKSCQPMEVDIMQLFSVENSQ
jgi:hypothetical protein